MCGRARLTFAEDELVQLYSRVVRREREAAGVGGGAGVSVVGGGGGGTGTGIGDGDVRWVARSSYRSPNIAPTALLPVLCRRGNDDDDDDDDKSNDFVIETMRWGIRTTSPKVPFVINARSETAAALASFSRSLASPSGRGVLAVEGYYEWKEEAGSGKKKKQPYFVHRSDGEPMFLAVLIERAKKRRADDVSSSSLPSSSSSFPSSFRCFVVLTRSPPRALRWLHDRAPCILPTEEMAREWLLLAKSGGGGRGGGKGAAAAAAAATKVLVSAGAAVEEASSSSSLSSSSVVSDEKKDKLPLLSWHPVTPEMGKTSYQRDDASRDIRKAGIASLFGKAIALVKKEAPPSPSPSPPSPSSSPAAVAVKEEKATMKPRPPPPNPLLPHSGVKREHKKDDSSQDAATKKKPKTTTPSLKGGQRSLDAFFSPQQEQKKDLN